jgi:NADP-dependent aldehyde dehydrogenase
MSSVIPVLLFPGALAAGPEALAKEFVGSLTQGAGQFCTCPGIVLACDGPALQRFLEAAGAALNATPGATMLTQEIHAGYEQGVRTRDVHPALERIGSGGAGPAEAYAAGALHAGDVSALLADRTLQDELFGASALVMRCRSTADFRAMLESMEGQLTVTLHIEPSDEPEASALIPLIERRAGRILANGWPTGVEVSRAIVHGGPFPATSDSRSTSVGTAAIERFLRPVCYQGLPEALLPPALRSSNPWNIPRTED